MRHNAGHSILYNDFEWYTCLTPGWSGVEFECTLHAAQPRQAIN